MSEGVGVSVTVGDLLDHLYVTGFTFSAGYFLGCSSLWWRGESFVERCLGACIYAMVWPILLPVVLWNERPK